jgi:hypothetical protein
MTDTRDDSFPSLPFEFTLEHLHTKNEPLLQVVDEGGVYEVESLLLTEGAFREMGPFFALELEESLDSLFRNIPAGSFD